MQISKRIKYHRLMQNFWMSLSCKCEVYYRNHKRERLGEALFKFSKYFLEKESYHYHYKWGLIELLHGEQAWDFTDGFLEEENMYLLNPPLIPHIRNFIKTYKSKKYISY